jgi:hypothetical protein
MKALLDALAKIEVSLESHSSMNEDRNPVLRLLQAGSLSTADLESVLSQYSLLPAQIVEFLSAGSSRLQEWTNVKAELERNVGEEMGSRTEGLSHYTILKRAVRKELGLNVSAVQALPSTRQFLHSIETGLADQSKAFVGGILYGLEASAGPELTIVATIINEYARLAELKAPINLSGLNKRVRVEENMISERYCLNVFFASHLWDFEVGHKNGLASSLIKDLPSSWASVHCFGLGFEHVLNEMDRWWDSLANTNEHSVEIRKQEIIEASNNLLA